MNWQVRILGISFALVGAGCIQDLDTAASKGESPSREPADAYLPCNGKQPFSSDIDPSGSTILCAEEDGSDIPVLIGQVPVFLKEGGTSTNPCDSITPQSLEIRKKYCGSCHAPPGGMGGFNYVLDDKQLVASRSGTYKDQSGNYLPMIVPGDPDHSWVYHRVESGAMPPTQPPPAASPPHPTVSDISILREWIEDCLGASAAGLDAAASQDAPKSDAPSNDASSDDRGREAGDMGH